MKCIKENKFLKNHIIICKPKLVMDECGMEEMQDVVEIIKKPEANPKSKKKKGR